MNLLDWDCPLGFIPGHIIETFKQNPEAMLRTYTVQTKNGALQSKVYRDYEAYSRDFDSGTKRCWITHYEPDDDEPNPLTWEEYPDEENEDYDDNWLYPEDDEDQETEQP